MHDSLFDYITRYGKQPLSDAEKHTISEIWEPKKLRKRQYFVEEGKVCQYTGFVLKGALRQFRVDEAGMEHILQLAIGNWWIADRYSFLNGTPSRYYIEAWEACELLQMHRSKLEIFLGIPAIRSMFWEMDQNNFIAAQKRLEDAISLPALKRYEQLQHDNPEFLQRFPQHQIASYLGVSKETLSRVRNPLARKR